METQNNAAVEIQRRKAILEAQERQPAADKIHRANVPDTSVPRSPAVTNERMHLAEYDRNDWVVNAEITHTIEDVLQPSYWAHMAQQLNPYDHIEVRAEDGTWIAQLIVIQTDRAWAKVALMSKYEISLETLPNAEPQHSVEWKGPQHRFAVIRLSDREMIRDKFQTKEEANAWMREHERVIST